MGQLQIGEAPYYEDEGSLKKWIRKLTSKWEPDINQIGLYINQTGTAGDVELEDKGTETIADIGKVAETWVAQISAYAEDVVVTLTWKDAAGTETVSTVTLTDANETAFTTPITTGYCATACSISVVNPGGVTVKVGVTGMGTPVATVQAGATAAVEADLSGTGKVYCNTRVDDATQRGKDTYLEYVTPWGEVKHGFSTMDAANSTAVEVFYEASSAYVATTVIVKDFYRRRQFKSEAIAVLTKEITIVNAGDTAIYAIIAATYMESLHSRYTLPVGRDGWLSKICLTQSIATNKIGNITINYTPYGTTNEVSCLLPMGNNSFNMWFPLLRLAENTEVTFTINSDAAAVGAQINFIEAVQV